MQAYAQVSLSCDEEIKSLINLIPQLDVPTRWSSCYFMIERALKLQKGLDHVAANLKELRQFELQEDDWKRLQEVLCFLKPFAETTRHIEGFKYPTLSSVIPLYNKLLDNVEDWRADKSKAAEIQKAAELVFDKLMKYYEKTTPIYLLATVLDPRLKLMYFKGHGWEIGDEQSGGENLIETRILPA